MNENDLRKYLEPSLYRILTLDQNATQEQIKSNYRGMSKYLHPDVSKESKEVAEEEFKRLKFAYEILSNPVSKTKYDKIYYEYLRVKSEKKKTENKMQSTKPQNNQSKKKHPIKTEDDFKRAAWELFNKSAKDFLDYLNEKDKKNKRDIN